MKKRYAFSLATMLLTMPLKEISKSSEYSPKKELGVEEAIPKEFSVSENYEKVIKAIIKQESRGNPRAYNKGSKASGLMQITPIVLKEWNQFHKDEHYSQTDLFNAKINKKIGEWYIHRLFNHYLLHYEIDTTLENLTAAYNWGIGGVVKIKDAKENFDKLPKETQNYITQIKKYLEIAN